MTKLSLSPEKRWTVEIIQQLGFGQIEQFSIRNGKPCFDPLPRVVEEVRLASDSERRPAANDADMTLKQEFENLFDHLKRLRTGVVVIEVRHSLPFRLIAERDYAGASEGLSGEGL